MDAIESQMPILCAADHQFASVDEVEGVFIKANSDSDGTPHWFPKHWVTLVDDAVHIDRTDDQAVVEWSDTPPLP